MQAGGAAIADKFGLGGGDSFIDKMPGHLSSLKLLFGTGGLFGGKGLPKGVMSGQDARKLLGAGYSVDDVLMKGPVGTYHPGQSMRQFEKMGVDPMDAYRLLASGGVGLSKLAKKFPELAAKFQKQGGLGGSGIGGGGASMGPMGFDPFMAMLPALMGNQSLFSNPNASGWLNQVFAQQMPQMVQPGRPSGIPPGGIPLGVPGRGGYNGPVGKTPPGPSPDPFVGLRGLSGPFGNGGGSMLPFQFNKR
jgi:hypothetical protein